MLSISVPLSYLAEHPIIKPFHISTSNFFSFYESTILNNLKQNMNEDQSMSSSVKNMMRALRAMVKRKARALKARIIIYSLLAQTNLLVSSIPLTTTVTHQQNHCQIQAQAGEVVAAAAAAETEAEAEPEAAAETEAEADVGIRSNGSVIEMVKNSKVEAGEEFSLEKDIDHVADLFIRNFHNQMRMQKQNSINRYQQLLFDGTL